MNRNDKILFITLLLFLALFKTSSAQSYQDLVNRSADYIDQKDYPAAEQTLKTALNKEPANPNNVLLFSNLGTIQRELKKYDEALLSYNLALAKFPTSPRLLHNRAALYCDMDSIDKALNDYNTILLVDNKNIEALYRKGLIHLEKMELENAKFDFQTINDIDPKNLMGNSGLALILKRQEKWKDAEELYSDLLYENRTNADLFLNRAECYLEQGKLGRAQEDLNKALSYGCNDPFFYILRGRLKINQYDKFGAKEDLKKARELGANLSIIEELEKHCR